MIKISASEMEVMAIIWNSDVDVGLPGSDIAAKVPEERQWSVRTVNTLLSRLVDKGALETVRDGRRFLYKPLISKEDYADRQTGQIIDRLFGGHAAPLVARLAKTRNLSKADIKAIKTILDQLEEE